MYHNPYPPQIPVEHLPTSAVPLWQNGIPVDLSVYISEDEYFVDYKATPAWQATNIKLGDTSDRREHHLEIPTTPVSWRHEKEKF